MGSPVFLHARIPVNLEPARVASRLRGDGQALVEAATADALADTAALRTNAGFRAQAEPTVAIRWPTADEVGVVAAVWASDDEATGWPRLELAVVVATNRDGQTELLLLSPSHPGYDLTTNRVDKLWRDRLGRGSVRAFGMALAARLTADVPAATGHQTDRPGTKPVDRHHRQPALSVAGST